MEGVEDIVKVIDALVVGSFVDHSKQPSRLLDSGSRDTFMVEIISELPLLFDLLAPSVSVFCFTSDCVYCPLPLLVEAFKIATFLRVIIPHEDTVIKDALLGQAMELLGLILLKALTISGVVSEHLSRLIPLPGAVLVKLLGMTAAFLVLY